jgi:hypothetical protein
VFPSISLFPLIPPNQEVLEQISEELQRDIFERKSRSVEELEEVQVLLAVEGTDGCDIGRAEAGVAALDDVFEVVSRNLGG